MNYAENSREPLRAAEKYLCLLTHYDLTARVIGLAIAVHKELEPGLSGCQVGLLLNFSALRLKDGLRRLVRARQGGEAAQQ